MYYQVHFGADYETGDYGWTTDLETVKRQVDWQLQALKTDYINYGFIDQLMFSINSGYDYQHGDYANGSTNERMDLYRRCEMEVVPLKKELNGNEKYHFFDTEFSTNEKSPGKISAGDIMLYGSDCLVTFYKSHSTSYPYTPVGKIENASGFAKAVGNGNVTITFRKAT